MNQVERESLIPRPPGTPKTGGRVKGTPNKKTEALQDILDRAEFNPVQTILDEIAGLSPEDRVKVCLDLMSYLYPKRRATELTVTDEARLKEMERLAGLTDDELMREIESELQARREKK